MHKYIKLEMLHCIFMLETFLCGVSNHSRHAIVCLYTVDLHDEGILLKMLSPEIIRHEHPISRIR